MIGCLPEKSQAHLILEDLSAENDRLRDALLDVIDACDNCGGGGIAFVGDETEYGQAPGSSAHACILCTAARRVVGLRVFVKPESSPYAAGDASKESK